MTLVKISKNGCVYVRSVPVRFYFLEQRRYLFVKTVGPDELLEIHYCFAGGPLDWRFIAAKASGSGDFVLGL